MAAQHRLFGAVERALAANDFGKARQLLRDHKSEFAGEPGWHDIREVFELITDCRELRARRLPHAEPGSWTSSAAPPCAVASGDACLRGAAGRPRWQP